MPGTIELLGPDDKLIVMLPDGWDDDAARHVVKVLNEQLPGRTLVFAGDVRVVVARPEGDPQ